MSDDRYETARPFQLWSCGLARTLLPNQTGVLRVSLFSLFCLFVYRVCFQMNRVFVTLSVVVLISYITTVSIAQERVAYTTIEESGEDYSIQGEYVGGR